MNIKEHNTSPFQRINKLLDKYFQLQPSLCIERAIIYTDVFKNTEGEPIIIRRAKAFKEYCQKKSINISRNELIIGGAASKPRAAIFCPEHASDWLKDEIDTLDTRHQDPYEVKDKQKKILKSSIFPYWEGKTISDHWIKQIPQDVKQIAVKTGIIDVEIKTQSAPGEIAPGFEMIINKGINFIINEAKEKLSCLNYTIPEDFEKINFYNAVIISLEALISLAKRYANLANKMMEEETNSNRKAELKKLSKICERVPAEPAQTFWEAVQLLWFIQIGSHMEGNGPSYSPGRVDQYLFPFYKSDIEKKELSENEVLEIIECLYLKFAENTWFLSKNAAMYFAGYQPYQNITVGGVKPDGSDATNELSYKFIKAKMDVQLHSPSLAVRIYKQSPEEFLLAVAKLSKMGTGFPAIHNDEAAIKMMLQTGATIEDARNYQLVGCVEPYIPGKMSKWTDGGHYNFASAIEFALTNGISLMNGNKQIGPKTGDPINMTFDELKEATKAHLAYFIRNIAIACHIAEKLHAELTPYPFMSSLIDGCLEKGMDITVGGAKYTIGPAFIGTGIADLSNSLATIKKFVYDNKSVSMEQMIDAIKNNFENRDNLKLKIINQSPAFGNDDDYVDNFAREMTDFAFNEITSYKSFRGPNFISGLYPVASHVPHGLVVSALPYGRLSGTPLADGCSPKGGTDRNGPTAVLKSVSKINHDAHVAGTLLNMRLDPFVAKDVDGEKRIAALLRSFVDLNIYHIQFNTIDSEMLREAQKNPDQYKSLIVRVAGYSAYFVELCREMQDDIIQRTIHAL
ncbi:MAG: glycyl radical protein [Desulfobacterales bacterium]|nr:glycyl radical protein [Desulfobacterales bacterium]